MSRDDDEGVDFGERMRVASLKRVKIRENSELGFDLVRIRGFYRDWSEDAVIKREVWEFFEF